MPPAAARVGPNPFVGPRPFELGERLYGRDRELTELYYRLSAERIVLLHSPSGAGKSSLVQAGLVPRLRQRFDVWRPTRVNQELPAGAGANRYVLSALQGFEEGIPANLRRGSHQLAGLTLASYLRERPRRPSAPDNVILIFDQFEEVLTADPLNTGAKREFFDQLGEALRHPAVWALFVLREDYLAPLDPYARQVPTHLRNRFRIDLLGLDAARDAMVQPAKSGGRDFPAADILLHDLATMKVQQPDGSFQKQTGEHVEPVQLQVVCRKLWADMEDDDMSIDPEDVKRFGNVSEALGVYYAGAVDKVAGDVQRQRAVRAWFDQELITPGGIRGQVLREENASGGLDNALVEALRGSHLIRAEQRAGATWYELAHDRLVEPVRKDNETWFDKHLSDVQRQASLWESQKRSSGLLLKDEDLVEGESWAKKNQAILTEVERKFLEISREAQDAVERERRQSRRIRVFAVAAIISVIATIIVAVFARWQWQQAKFATQEAKEKTQEAKEKTQEAKEKAQEAEAERKKADTAKTTADVHSRRADKAKTAVEQLRKDALRLREEADRATGVARDAERLAENLAKDAETQRKGARRAEVDAEDRRIRAKEAEDRLQRLQLRERAQELAVTSLDPEREKEVAALLALEAYHIDRKSREKVASPLPRQIFEALRRTLDRVHEQDWYGPLRAPATLPQGGQVRTLAWSPYERDLFTGSDDGRALWYRLKQQGPDRACVQFSSAVTALAVSPNGELLAVGTAVEGVHLWKLHGEDAAAVGVSECSENSPFEGVEILAEEEIPVATAGDRRLKALVFVGDQTLVSAYRRCRDKQPQPGCASPQAELLLWRSQNGWQPSDPYSLSDAGRRTPLLDVTALTFDPRAPNTFAVASPQDVAWFEIPSAPRDPQVPDVVHELPPPENDFFRQTLRQNVRALAYRPDGRLLALGLESGEIVVWDREGKSLSSLKKRHTSAVTALSFSPATPRPRYLASTSFDGTVMLQAIGRHDDSALLAETIEIGDHQGWVWDVAFRPGGREIASGGADRTVRWWKFRAPDLLAAICDSVGRNLTPEEWTAHVVSDLTRDLLERKERCPETSATEGISNE